MSKSYYFDPKKYKKELTGIVSDLLALDEIKKRDFEKIVRKYPKDKSEIFSKDQVLMGIDWIEKHPHPNPLPKGEGKHLSLTDNEVKRLKESIKMKPTRTISGVTTVTVLTKPFPCPGKCIFCPNDVRMPKSYIATEPGAQRAIANRFSPYLQTWNRLQALKNIGHPTDKIELLVLGGTWSSYSEEYQIWFISECFRAMNEFGRRNVMVRLSNHDRESTLREPQGDKLVRKLQSDERGFKFEDEKLNIQKYLESDWNDELREIVGDKPYNELIFTKEFKEHFANFLCSEDSALPREQGWKELEKLHEINATAGSRCVGLVLETRPDSITEYEALRLRKLGATKVQLGIQTLNDKVSEMNKRGEGREETSRAVNLLRQAGFKIHAHIMPNLYGATPVSDRESYHDLFNDLNYKPDEVKIYPTSTIKHTELHDLYEKGEYKPYETEELISLMADLIEMTPEYCRLTRIIRDIPSTEIEAGNKTTNLREVVEHRLEQEGRVDSNIRAREVKGDDIAASDLSLDIIEFETEFTNEQFLQYITKDRRIAGFLRLSFPKENKNKVTGELDNMAMIREVHVYGPSLKISKDSSGEAQHIGLGSSLIEKAKEISKEKGFKKLAVISAIGTREYYRKRGFELDRYYQIANL